MKIRIEGNSIRLRLRQSEVAQLAEKGRVGEATHLPGGVFRYELTLQSGLEDLSAYLGPEGIAVNLPEGWGQAWPDDSRVGFEGVLPLDGGKELHLLVEKDFVCLDRDLSAQQDQYPHPKGNQA